MRNRATAPTPVQITRSTRTIWSLQTDPACSFINDRGAEGFGLSVQWAQSEDEVRLAQRLRYRVFTEEIGAILAPPAGTPAGVDADRFDPFCDHLLVRARRGPADMQGAVVGTYRVLPPAAARRAGGLYADTEFDLGPLRSLRAHAVELGRSCVHPAWRSGAVILALWAALAQYMQLHGLDTMIGCASVGIADGGKWKTKVKLMLNGVLV